MRIVIDMQGAQGNNQQRGIGRYTRSLSKAIVRNRGAHEVYLALNGSFSDTIEPIRAIFDGLLPQENIRIWQSPGPVSYLDDPTSWRRCSAELLRESFLASLRPDIVLVSSLFEGLVDDVVTSVGSLGRTIPTAVILYDLIPLIRRAPYLDSPVVNAWYGGKLDHLRRADLLLAISESSRQEGASHLDIPADMCVNISTAADPQFQPKHTDYEREQSIRLKYRLPRQFVMYTGGIDHRKNIEGLIRAYGRLPALLRNSHQLAIVCSVQPASRTTLETLAKAQGLKSDELVLTGFVPEEDLLTLYNLCKAFIFPSLHEGFGLPALEAMSCGRAVIGANTSSLPEVIGRADALFDPMSDTAITEKLIEVLTDDCFRLELEQHGLKQAQHFSWDDSGRRAIAAIELLHVQKINESPEHVISPSRPRLAYISPLPPERSGISDYSEELIIALSHNYEIDVIVAQDVVSSPWIKANCPIRNVKWFRAHAGYYDRVLYHFGNSNFHKHMFSLLEEIPGVVVLHDFFLSGIVAHMDVTGYRPGAWTRALYQDHGYKALKDRFHASNTADVVWRYPCNLNVLRGALGVVVHSEHARQLATAWYGGNAADDLTVVPLLRVSEHGIDRAVARRQLGLNEDDFVVCSFGLLGITKLNHRLLESWIGSTLSKDANCVLLFVGKNERNTYGSEFVSAIKRSGLEKRIRITGWVDTNTYRNYLASADVGVQLRALSRGETSAAVLDCMNYSLATIVNDNGSMADLPDHTIWKLPDKFDNIELSKALETLRQEPSRRQQLGARGRMNILAYHSPQFCADKYSKLIESAYYAATTNVNSLIRGLAQIESAPTESNPLVELARAIDITIPPKLYARQLLVDISELVQRDSKSGIQRVVRSILQELLTNPPEGFRVEPVYATINQGYRYARCFTLGFLDCPPSVLKDEIIDYRAGDRFIGLDLQPQVIPAQQYFYQKMRENGIQVKFVVYDLLPINLPEAFPKGAAEGHHSWLSVVAENDGAICISKAVASELQHWFNKYGRARQQPLKISWFHLGADINGSAPSKGMPKNADLVASILAKRPTFLMVGTLEPRKGHAQTLSAFEQLWADGIEANLVIVGKRGWMMEALVDRLNDHTQMNSHLFWLEGISDEYLNEIYAASTCLIAASEGEGFGLPLIEAAFHKLDIIARNIPVFYEVAGNNAYYFKGLDPHSLVQAIKEWLELYAEDRTPKSSHISRVNWRESVVSLLSNFD